MDFARSGPSLPFGGRAVALYGFVLLYCLAWALLGPASKPDLFFNEGGPIDGLSTILFTTAAVTAWIVFWLVRGSGTPVAWFWLASAAGLAFFAIDDRFQLHERFDDDWMEPAFGAAPLGFRNWNDIAVLGYGAVALVMLAVALPAILRYRQTAVFLGVAFLCYGTHSFIDSMFRRVPAKEITEEIFKVLTGASLVMAYLQAALAAGAAGVTRRPFFRRHVVALGAVTTVFLLLMYLGPSVLQRAMVRKWGLPDSWLASVVLGAAAVLCWFSWLPTRPGGRFGNALGCAAAAFLGWLAFDEATLSGWTILHKTRTPPLVSELLDGRLASLHRSLTVSAIAAVVAAVLLLVLWRRRLLVQRRTVALLGVAIGCVVAAAASAPFPDDPLGFLGSALRLAACGSVLVAVMIAFTARITADEPDPTGERPPRRRALSHAVAWVAVVSLVVVAMRMKQVGVNPFSRLGDNGFRGALDDGDYFGRSVALMGSSDGAGLVDLAVGAPGDDAAGRDRGAVWMLSIDGDGTVVERHKINGGFSGSAMAPIGRSVAAPGDIDGDGVADLAVGAHTDGDGGRRRGGVWILFLERDGTVRSHQKISSTQGGFTGALRDGDQFGCSLAPLGDLDGDGIPDLAVGARMDDDGGPGRGAVWVLFLNRDGTVKTHRKISATRGGLDAALDDGDRFGESMAAIGDFNGDGVTDLVVGAEDDDDGGANRGAVWLLFLGADGGVKSHAKISSTHGGFTGILADDDDFGHSVASMGDLDGDGVIDLAVGADEDRDGGASRGAVWMLFLNADGTVKAHQKISDTRGGFDGALYDGDEFGESVASPGDLDGDGVADLLVGTKDDGVGQRNRGAVWVLFLRPDGTVVSHTKISD